MVIAMDSQFGVKAPCWDPCVVFFCKTQLSQKFVLPRSMNRCLKLIFKVCRQNIPWRREISTPSTEGGIKTLYFTESVPFLTKGW